MTTVGDNTVAVGIENGSDAFHGVITLGNDSAVFMFKKLQDGISLPELIAACMKEYPDSTVDEVGPNVIEFLNKIQEQGLLLADPNNGFGIDDEKG